jgi:hypothetical protein
VVQILDNMIREKVKFEDFNRIAKEHEYFLWHFLMEEQYDSQLGLWSIFDTKKDFDGSQIINPIDVLLSEINVPYFESYTKDSIDFLINLGLDGKYLYRHIENYFISPRRMSYHPVIIGFKKKSHVWDTHKTCYCIEGITEIILRMNPDLFPNIELE